MIHMNTTGNIKYLQINNFHFVQSSFLSIKTFQIQRNLMLHGLGKKEKPFHKKGDTVLSRPTLWSLPYFVGFFVRFKET